MGWDGEMFSCLSGDIATVEAIIAEMIIIIVIVFGFRAVAVAVAVGTRPSLVVLSSGNHFWHAFGSEHFLWELLENLFHSGCM